MTLSEFARATELARVGQVQDAARMVLETLTDDQESVAQRLLDAAHWSLQDIEQFEEQGEPLFARGPWGAYWIAPVKWLGALIPPAPKVTLAGVYALAQGLLKQLKEENGTIQEEAHRG